MNQGWTYHDRVKPSEAGQSLLSFYTQRYTHSTPETWASRIACGQVLLEGTPASAETGLQAGQRLTYHRAPWQEPEVPLTFEVLYEDTDLLIVNKPAGLPVLPGGNFLDHTLLRLLQQRYPHETPVPIHRLGRGTSGLLLLARSPLAKAHLSQQLRDRRLHKLYRALVGAGNFPDRLTITEPIGQLPHPQLGYVYGITGQGAFAQSEVQVLRRGAQSTLVAVSILTGRPHQIRIHLAAVGFPLLGDPLYEPGGTPRSFSSNPNEKQPVPGDCGYHLHAYKVGFIHPHTQKTMTVICPAPPALCEPLS